MKTEIAATDGTWETLNDFPLRLRAGLRFRSEGPGNDWMCFLEDSIEGRSYAMSQWQREFLELIEARTPAQDAARLVIASYPDLVSQEAVTRLVRWLTAEDLLEKISTLQLPETESEPVAAPEPGLKSVLDRVRLHPRRAQFAMNAVAGLLIVAGVLMMKPALAARSGASVEGESASATHESERFIPVRAVSGGILAEIFVHDGDEIDAGDLIARIDDPIELHLLEDLKRELGETRVRRDRFYQDSNHEEYLAEMRRIAVLSRQIGFSEARANLAELRAPIGGLVETEVLCGQVGSTVARGDILLKVHPLASGDPDLLAGNP